MSPVNAANVLDVVERDRAGAAECTLSPMRSSASDLRNGCARRGLDGRPRVPDPGDRRQHVGRALHGRALHVVQHGADAAELLAAAGAAGAAVHEMRNGGAVACRGAGVVAVEDQHAAVERGDASDEFDGDLGVVRGDAGDEGAATAGDESRWPRSVEP